MSRLVLVRHGQARGVLTPHGEMQARLLGDWFAGRGMTFSEVICGSLDRQCQTARLIASHDAAIDPRWNEYATDGVIERLAPLLAARNAEFRKAIENWERERHSPDWNRHFQRMFEPLMNAYTSEELAAPEVETWSAFRERVRAALAAIVNAQGRSRNVLVVTSG